MTRGRIFLTVLVPLATLLLPLAAKAQETPLPEPGARVRLAVASVAGRTETVVGTLVAAGADSLVVDPEGRDEPRVLRARWVRTLEVSRGRGSRSASAAKYGVMSAAAGAAVGALIGSAASEGGGGSGWEILSRGEVAAIGAVWVGGLAGIGGALYGRAYPEERWSPAALPGAPTARVGLDREGGVAVSVSLKL